MLDPRDVGDQGERQLNQYVREGQIRQRDHEQEQMQLLAEESQLGQPPQRLRVNAGASYQRGRHFRNARMGLTGSEEILRSEEDAEGDGRNPEEFDEEMGDGGGAARRTRRRLARSLRSARGVPSPTGCTRGSTGPGPRNSTTYRSTTR